MADLKLHDLINLILSFPGFPEELRSFYQSNREILSEGSKNILVLIPYGEGTPDYHLPNICEQSLFPDNIFILFFPSHPVHYKLINWEIPGMTEKIWEIIPEAIKDYGIDVNFPFLIESFFGVDNSRSANIIIFKDISDREFLWNEVTTENVRSILSIAPSSSRVSDPSVTLQQLQDELNECTGEKFFKNLLPVSINDTVSSILSVVKNPESINETIAYLFNRMDSFEYGAVAEHFPQMVGAVSIPTQATETLQNWIAGFLSQSTVHAVGQIFDYTNSFREGLRHQLNRFFEEKRDRNVVITVLTNSDTREKLESESKKYLAAAEELELYYLTTSIREPNKAIITSIVLNYCKVFEYELSCSIDHLVRKKLSIELPEYFFRHQNNKTAVFKSKDRINFLIDYNKKNKFCYFKDKDWLPVTTGRSLVVFFEMNKYGAIDELSKFFSDEQLDVLNEMGDEIKNIRNVSAHSMIDIEELSRVKNGLAELESKGVFEAMFKIKELLKSVIIK